MISAVLDASTVLQCNCCNIVVLKHHSLHLRQPAEAQCWMVRRLRRGLKPRLLGMPERENSSRPPVPYWPLHCLLLLLLLLPPLPTAYIAPRTLLLARSQGFGAKT